MKKLHAGVVLGVMAAATASQAAITISYPDFSNVADLQLNGDAATTTADDGHKVLRLSKDVWESGNAFRKDPIGLLNNASFSSFFSFQITRPGGISDSDGQGADGMVFVVHRQLEMVGGSGGGIGYEGIIPSLGVEFDTWDNLDIDGNNGNHVGVNHDGSLESVALVNINTRMNNGAIWYAWVDYQGAAQKLEVRLAQTDARPASPTLSHTVDLAELLGITDPSDAVYVGFTSGTGDASGAHDLRSWVFTNDYVPVPEPSGLLSILGLTALAGLKRVRRNQVE